MLHHFSLLTTLKKPIPRFESSQNLSLLQQTPPLPHFPLKPTDFNKKTSNRLFNSPSPHSKHNHSKLAQLNHPLYHFVSSPLPITAPIIHLSLQIHQNTTKTPIFHPIHQSSHSPCPTFAQSLPNLCPALTPTLHHQYSIMHSFYSCSTPTNQPTNQPTYLPTYLPTHLTN